MQHVYLNQEVLLEVAKREHGILKRIELALNHHNLVYVVEQLATVTETKAAKRNEKLIPIVRFGLNTTYFSFLSPSSELLNVKIQKQKAVDWMRLLEEDFQLTYEVDASGQRVIFQAHANKFNFKSQTTAVAYAFNYINDLAYSIIETFPQQAILLLAQQKLILEEAVESLLFSTLKHTFTRDVYWEWNESVNDFSVLWLPDAKKTDAVAVITKQATISSSHVHEIQSTLSSVKGLQNGSVFMNLANLIIYPTGEKEPLLELDGIAVTIDKTRKEIVLTLIEAKDQNKGAQAAAKKQLKDAIGKLDVHPNATMGKIRVDSRGSKARAWTHIRLAF